MDPNPLEVRLKRVESLGESRNIHEQLPDDLVKRITAIHEAINISFPPG
jgi:hypothetical protein